MRATWTSVAMLTAVCIAGAVAPTQAQSPDPSGPYARFADAMKKVGVTEPAPHFFASALCSGCRETGFFCTKRIGSVSDLKGRKIRVNPQDSTLIGELRSIGAVSVILPADDLAPALERDVVSCVAYAPTGADSAAHSNSPATRAPASAATAKPESPNPSTLDSPNYSLTTGNDSKFCRYCTYIWHTCLACGDIKKGDTKCIKACNDVGDLYDKCVSEGCGSN